MSEQSTESDYCIDVIARSTIQFQQATMIEVIGSICGTENITTKPAEILATELARIIKQLPLCQKLIIENGQPIKFRQIEGFNRNEVPLEDIYLLHQFGDILERYGTVSSKA